MPEMEVALSPTSLRSVTETVNGSHKFVIQGYSLAKGMGVGKHIACEIFTVGGFQWAIYFYPNGKNSEDNSTNVSVFIALASEGTDVRVLFELTLVDQSGKRKHKVHSHFDRSLESGPCTLKYRGSMWGYKHFFHRAALQQELSLPIRHDVHIIAFIRRLDYEKGVNIITDAMQCNVLLARIYD